MGLILLIYKMRLGFPFLSTPTSCDCQTLDSRNYFFTSLLSLTLICGLKFFSKGVGDLGTWPDQIDNPFSRFVFLSQTFCTHEIILKQTTRDCLYRKKYGGKGSQGSCRSIQHLERMFQTLSRVSFQATAWGATYPSSWLQLQELRAQIQASETV